MNPELATKELWQVDLGYACFGVVVQDNRVVEVAPIGKWMLGKRWDMLKVKKEFVCCENS